VQAGVNEPGRVEKVDLRLPAGLRLTPVADKTLSDMLVSGDVDAVLSAAPPACFEQGHVNILRLFENYREVETAYYRETSIFPIMHVVTIRRELVDSHPWIAVSLLKAFEEAKRRSVARALDIKAPRFPIPWCYDDARQAQATFGADYWPYGIEANRATLEAFLRYAHEQGVCHRVVAVEELFPKSVRSSFKI